MMVVFDTSHFVLALDDNARPPTDPATGKPVERCKERVRHLIATLSKARTSMLIPIPVVAEYLVKIRNKQEFVDKLVISRYFEVGVFDLKAAIELSMLVDPDLQGTKTLDDKTTKAKMTFDRQIVAIAKVRGADRLYTDDQKLAALARNNGIAAVMTWDIPLPPPADLEFDFSGPNETKPSSDS